MAENRRVYRGIVFIGDPHVASFAPGHRRDDYRTTVLGKLSFAVETAHREQLLPLVLGDLFHVPRNNPNSLLVELIELFRPVIPWVLLGNHDKYEARFSSDLSIAVLEAAGAIRLIKEQGVVEVVSVGRRRILIGASPDWTSLPREVERNGSDVVVWVTHHNLLLDEEGVGGGERLSAIALREIPGVDVVVNGHLHTPKPPLCRGMTRWMNPGSIVRIIRSRHARLMTPSLLVFIPEDREPFQYYQIPHRPFEEVFDPYEHEGSSLDEQEHQEESLFIRGLENLALRRTAEGVGLREFLAMNLRADDAVDRYVWELYREVMSHERS